MDSGRLSILPTTAKCSVALNVDFLGIAMSEVRFAIIIMANPERNQTTAVQQIVAVLFIAVGFSSDYSWSTSHVLVDKMLQ